MPARWRGRAQHTALALVAYVPLLLTHRGEVSADTKTYLYLDPGRLLAKAPYMWDAGTGLGTVTHQTLGYLFPMGPYYWLMQTLGFPDWVAQRIWLGTILFAAGTGVLFLMRTMGWRAAEPPLARGMVVAAAVYMLSPYVLDYAARISVILLPFAALPWLVGIAMRAAREGGWRWPAWFAVVIALVGGVNATALLFAGIGPVLWFVYAMWVSKEVDVRRALAAVGRIGALTIGVSLWWIAGLWAQGKYGIPILRYTETYETVAKVSNAPELLRGLGYWFFYGDDKLGPWIEPSVAYTQHLWLIGAGYLLAIGALLAAGALRWKQRGYFVALLAVGTLIAVGSNPFDDPSPYGSLFSRFAHLDLGLALRSTPRAVPLIVLSLAVMLGAGTRGLARWRPTLGLVAAVTAVAVAVINLPPLFTGQMVADNLQRPEDIPSYWQQDADYLDAQGDATRVLELPGSDFASYRWGNTVDPVLPGLMDRPYVARELIPYGSAPSADLLNAFDRRLQEGWYEPASLATVAALMGVGEINVRSDLQYERYRTPRPRNLWADIEATPGLGAPEEFGDAVPNRAIPDLPLIDEVALGTSPDAADPPPVAAFPVEKPRDLVRAENADGVMLIAGSGEGIVDAAAAGIIAEAQPVLYSASFADDPDGMQRALDDDAHLVLTDTNRRQARRWGTVRENVGVTERVGEKPLVDDPTDNRLEVFPGAGDDTMTTVEQRGVARVDATAYGNPVSYTPDDRPANALDGDPRTAWRVGAFSDVRGERWEVELTNQATTDHVAFLQPITGSRNRFITEVRLRFDGRDPMDVALDVSSRSRPGQTIDIGSHTFTTLSIEILDTDIGYRPSYKGISPVGFAELDVAGAKVDEVVHLPTDLLSAAGTSSIDHPLDVVMTRQRGNPAEPARTDDEETSIQRAFDLPTERSFAVEGDARLSARAPDTVLDTLLGRPDAEAGGVTATSTARLDGDLSALASSAIDDDPSTAWQTPFAFVQGNVTTYTSATPFSFDHLDLVVFADGRHSVPTELTITADDGTPVVVRVAPVADDPSRENTTQSQRIDLPRSITAKKVAIQLSGIRAVTTIDYYSETPVTMPVGIAEWGISGLSVSPLASTVDTGCKPLLEVDGKPVSVRATGPTADVLARRAMTLTGCKGDSVTVPEGEVRVGTTVGKDAGVDLDRVVLRSAAGGAAFTLGESPTPDSPTVTVEDEGRVSYKLRVDDATAPFWLVLGQSQNDGWKATVNGAGSLGAPTLIDGYANGWYVTPTGSGPIEVTLSWTPQKVIWIAIGLSALALVGCIALLAVEWARRRSRVEVNADDGPELATLRQYGGLTPSRVTVGLATVVTGLVLWFMAGPAVGALAALTVLCGLLWPRVRPAVILLAPAALAGAALFILAKQLRYSLEPSFEWPTYFDKVHVLGWIAVSTLLADLVVREVRSRVVAPAITEPSTDLSSSLPQEESRTIDA